MTYDTYGVQHKVYFLKGTGQWYLWKGYITRGNYRQDTGQGELVDRRQDIGYLWTGYRTKDIYREKTRDTLG
jgi:hypothetical protein